MSQRLPIFSPLSRLRNKENRPPASSRYKDQLAVVLGQIENVDLIPTERVSKYKMLSKSPSTGTLREHSGVLVPDTEEDLEQLASISAGTQNPSAVLGIFQRFAAMEHDVSTMKHDITQLKHTVQQQNGTIAQQNGTIEQLKHTVQQQNGRIKRRDNRIAKLHGQIEKLHGDIALLKFEKSELATTVTDLTTIAYGDGDPNWPRTP
jgi:uncharacterized coiled-coil protein SlyX